MMGHRSPELRGRRSRLLLWAVAGLWLVGLAGTTARTPGAGAGSGAPDSEHVTRHTLPSPGASGQDQETGAAQDRIEHAEAPGEGHEGPDVAHFLLVLIAILVAGKIGGELAERIGQPAVLGELLGGVLLGASVLGVIPPPGSGTLAEIIHLLAEVGVVILLFEIGLETDLDEMFRIGPAALAVAFVGVVFPFLLGAAYWYFADPDLGVHPPGVSLAKIAIFVGATLTATSVGITARVLSDLDRMHTREARTIIGAAVIDDVLGLVMLALVVGLVAGDAVTVGAIAWALVKAVGFLVLAVIVGKMVGPVLFDFVDRLRVRGVLLVAAFSFALLLAALADLADSAMIIGSFAAGIILSTTNQFDLVVERIEPVADVFTPIFFVSVGANVNLDLFLPWTEQFSSGVLIIGATLTGIAIVGKAIAGWAAPWEKMNRLAIGVGMVPRGEVGLIFADIGLRGGLLSQAVFSAILIMVMVSTFIAPPLLKWIFQREGTGEPAPVAEPVSPHGGGSD